MKKTLILILTLSFAFSGTMYMAYDFDESENVALGYNHTFKTWTCEETGKPCWILAGGVNYDVVADGPGFASVYALPMKFVADNVGVWATLGFATVTDDGGADGLDGGLVYGLGVHYYLNENLGLGLGMVNNDWELGIFEDTLERMNLNLTYTF